MLSQRCNIVGNEYKAEEENNKDSDHNTNINSITKIIYEISLSRIFALDRGPDIADMEKLRYMCDTLGQNTFHNQIGGSMWTGLAEVQYR